VFLILYLVLTSFLICFFGEATDYFSLVSFGFGEATDYYSLVSFGIGRNNLIGIDAPLLSLTGITPVSRIYGLGMLIYVFLKSKFSVLAG
jgi:hypothetical protein